MKICKTCKQTLPLDQFHVSKNQKQAVRSDCRACVSVYWKQKNQTHPNDYKVYLIRDKATEDILYVGSTKQSLLKRFRDHIGDRKFVRGTVKMELVQEDLREPESLKLEALLIEQYRPRLNVYSGYKIHPVKSRIGGQKSSEWREAIRKANSRPIMCLNTGRVYESLREASKQLGLTESKVSQVCQGKRPHTKGYKFSYL